MLPVPPWFQHDSEEYAPAEFEVCNEVPPTPVNSGSDGG